MSHRIRRTSCWTTNPSRQGNRIAPWGISVLLLVVSVPALVAGTSGAPASSLEPTPSPRGNATASVTISNGTITDEAVTVDRVTVPEGGYLVIHRSAYVFDDRPAPIGVSAYLSPGTHRNVTVSLTASTVTNRTRGVVAAVVHRDDGDEQFEHVENRSVDQPYRQSNDTVVDTATISVPGVRGYTTTPPASTSRETKTETSEHDTSRELALESAEIIGLAVGGVLVALAVVVLISLQHR